MSSLRPMSCISILYVSRVNRSSCPPKFSLPNVRLYVYTVRDVSRSILYRPVFFDFFFLTSCRLGGGVKLYGSRAFIVQYKRPCHIEHRWTIVYGLMGIISRTSQMLIRLFVFFPRVSFFPP
jgi:hypothetical protein